MSNLVVPDAAKVQQLKNQLGSGTPTVPTTYRLFKNNYTVVHGTVRSDLTECDFSGYSAITLAGLSVSGSLDGSGRAVATWTAATRTKSGATGNTCYGYWCDDAAGNLMWAETFDAGVPLSTDGQYIQITPKFTGMSQYANT